MWHVALVALCVVAVILLAAMLSAALGMERSWKKAAAHKGSPAAKTVPGDADESRAAPAVVNVPPAKEMWVDSEYCWVVVCKNDSFHRHPNVNNVHRIPLGQTDAVEPRPAIDKPFSVACDECRKEYVYRPLEVLRWEMEAPPSFVPHSLFK